jgi:hypothetical protein
MHTCTPPCTSSSPTFPLWHLFNTTIQKMLVIIQTQSKAITYESCIIQIFFCIICGVGQLPPSYDGLWLLCGDLSPLALNGFHDFTALCTAAADVLDHKCPNFLVTKLHGVAVPMWKSHIFSVNLVSWFTLPVLTLFLITWWWICQLGCWVVIPLPASFTLLPWYFLLFVESHQLEGSTKHFPSVHFTS